MTYLHCLLVSALLAFGLGVDVEYIQIRSLQRRSIDGLERLHVRAFGEDHHLVLKPANILSPNFHIVSIRNTGDKELRETLPFTDDGNFYSVVGKRAAVYMNNRNVRTLEGLLDHNIVITPHVKKRSPSDIATHVVRRSELKAISDDMRYPNDSKPNNTERSHINLRQMPPTKVTVEVLAFIDYRNSKALNFDTNKLATYVGIFWNSVSHVYSDLKNPQVGLAVSGLVITKDSIDEPYISNNLYGTNGIQDNMLGDFQKWVAAKESSLPKHDTVMLHTPLDLGTLDKGQWTSSLAGLAHVGTTCRADGWETGFFEDTLPDYTGVLVAAHELAHTLNVEHDGSGSGASCSGSKGYVMGSSLGNTPNAWKFSSCSQKAMSSFLRSSKGTCTYNKPTTVVSSTTDLPFSQSVTLDDLCKARHGNSYAFYGKIEPAICSNVWCAESGNSKLSSKGGAIEGTPCDIGKICLKGDCVASNIPSLDNQCSNKFGTGWTATQKDSSSVCSNLQCSNGSSKKSLTAAAGSACGNYGVCKNGECTFQLLSLDDQCKRNFDSNYHSDLSQGTDVCKQLWCTQDNRRLTSRGGADSYSPCGSGMVCRAGQCGKQ